jgi:hypothetical protein
MSRDHATKAGVSFPVIYETDVLAGFVLARASAGPELAHDFRFGKSAPF